MRIALYQPDIPQNTGAILRLAACMNVAVDLIGPAGFDMSDRAFKRAGLDYLDDVIVCRHRSWHAFADAFTTRKGDSRLILMTTKARQAHIDFAFQPDDTLLFGRESAGVPDDVANADVVDQKLRIPIRATTRSLNVALSVALTLGEALRQTDGFPHR